MLIRLNYFKCQNSESSIEVIPRDSPPNNETLDIHLRSSCDKRKERGDLRLTTLRHQTISLISVSYFLSILLKGSGDAQVCT